MNEEMVVNIIVIMGLVGLGLMMLSLFIWLWVMVYNFYKEYIKVGE
jgi:hypothetical protein